MATLTINLEFSRVVQIKAGSWPHLLLETRDVWPSPLPPTFALLMCTPRKRRRGSGRAERPRRPGQRTLCQPPVNPAATKKSTARRYRERPDRRPEATSSGTKVPEAEVATFGGFRRLLCAYGRMCVYQSRVLASLRERVPGCGSGTALRPAS